MAKLTHLSARTAASLGIDVLLKKVNRNDREGEMLKLVDIMEKFMEGDELELDYDWIRGLVGNKDTALNDYLNRGLDELDPHVIKTTALNLGFEAMLSGTKTMHAMRKEHG